VTSVPILTAIADPNWEAELTAELSRDDAIGLVVVRRCVDVADLVAAATADLARAVVLSGDLRRLDRGAVGRLTAVSVAVVGLVEAHDDATERRLRELGVRHVSARGVPAEQLAATVHAAIAGLTTAAPTPAKPEPSAPVSEPGRGGSVIAVWGAAGAPGRSTVAVNLAAELAAAGRETLLVDADTYGGAVAQLLGVLDESPGLAAACRLAGAGDLDGSRLADAALAVRPGLRVLTGIARPDRWPELSAAALCAVLDGCRALAEVTVVDCGFCLERDDEPAHDATAPRRNAATLAALAAADRVVGIAAADPLGLARYVRALPDCVECCRNNAVTTVVNRLREGVVGPGDARRQVVRALHRYAGIAEIHVVPDDRGSLDAALAAGRALAEVAPKSAARHAIRDLATSIIGEPRSKHRRSRRWSAV